MAKKKLTKKKPTKKPKRKSATTWAPAKPKPTNEIYQFKITLMHIKPTIWRRIQIKDRDHRSPNATPDGPEKSLWGKEQRAWLEQTLQQSDATWRVIISPTPMVGPDRASKRDNHANLGGFRHEAEAFFYWAKTTTPRGPTSCSGGTCRPASPGHLAGSKARRRQTPTYRRRNIGRRTATRVRGRCSRCRSRSP